MSLYLLKKENQWIFVKGEILPMTKTFEGVVLYSESSTLFFSLEELGMSSVFDFEISMAIKTKEQFLKTREIFLKSIVDMVEGHGASRTFSKLKDFENNFVRVTLAAKELFSLTDKECSIDEYTGQIMTYESFSEDMFFDGDFEDE